ncbi:unnamed protein product [Brassica rapa subsp. trilocularis]
MIEEVSTSNREDNVEVADGARFYFFFQLLHASLLLFGLSLSLFGPCVCECTQA